MEYLNKNKRILLVGLNPTEQAKKHNAVFCQTNGLWKILDQSTIISNDIKGHNLTLSEEEGGKYKYFAGHYFGPESIVGFTDLVPNNFSKNGNKVKVSQKNIEDFMQKIAEYKIQKIGLLGKKVTKELFPELRNQKINYGKLPMPFLIDSIKIPVFCLPFPETVPMTTEAKAKYYSMLK